MTARILVIITVLVVCHLLLAPAPLTSQMQPGVLHRETLLEATQAGQQAMAERQQADGLPQLTLPGEEVTIRAREQEKAGDLFMVRGDVEITFRTYIFQADEITYDHRTGDVNATGNIRFTGGPHDEFIQASRAQYNVRSETGEFHDVVGTTGVRFRGLEMTLTTSDPFAFSGRLVEKTGRERLVVHDGMVTSCRLPNPDWSFNASRLVIDLDDRARAYNSTFRLNGVPVMYLPYASYPVRGLQRKSGFLMPSVGASGRRGTTVGESFYWAINRSMDATLGAEWYARRGWAQIGEFRARPSDSSYISANYFGVIDRREGMLDEGGQDIRLNAESMLPGRFRGVTSLNYLSSFVFRLAFMDTFTEAVNSELTSLAFLSRSMRGTQVNVSALHYRNFQSVLRGDFIEITRAPGVEVSTYERQLGNSLLYWAGEVAADGVSRSQPGFETAPLVGRVDVRPRLSVPRLLHGWTLRPEVALRSTTYTQRRELNGGGAGLAVDEAVHRRALEFTLEMRPPTLMRIFGQTVAGNRVKHTIEPRAVYRRTAGVDAFHNILRFDLRDVLSNTHEVEYALVNRIYAKPQNGDSVNSQEFLSWEISQKYFIDPTFGGALVAGRRNVFTTTALFTGVAFLTEPRRFSPVVSRLRVQPHSDMDVQWQIDIDPVRERVNASNVFASWRFGEFTLGALHAFLQSPGELFVTQPLPSPERFNQLRMILGYGGPAKRGLSLSTHFGVDANQGFLQYAAVQGGYNGECCGFSMEYRRFSLGAFRVGTPFRRENQVRFALTLANVGTFGNIRRPERWF